MHFEFNAVSRLTELTRRLAASRWRLRHRKISQNQTRGVDICNVEDVMSYLDRMAGDMSHK